MRFREFLTEDLEKIRNYKKAVFDLKVAIKELEFERGAQIEPDNPEKRLTHLNKLATLKMKIIMLKDKIMKLGLGLNDGKETEKEEVSSNEWKALFRKLDMEIDADKFKELLDKIPDKGSPEEEKLKKEKERLTK